MNIYGFEKPFSTMTFGKNLIVFWVFGDRVMDKDNRRPLFLIKL